MQFREFLENNWSSLKPGRQKELPFMHEPGYNRKANSYLDQDLIAPEFEENNQFNLYHVTTNLAAVKSSGKLKSRRELGVVGLGGGGNNEDPHLISTTYDLNRAHEIYDEMKLVCQIVRGQVPASTLWNGSKLYEPWDNSYARSALKSLIPKNIYKQLYKGELDIEVINQYINTPEQLYEFFQELEEAATKQEQEAEDTYHYSAIGFTGSFQDMLKINPNQIAIIQVVARKNAPAKHVNLEKELRFKPQDLKIIRFRHP